MQRLSESLTDLAGRVRRLEESAAAVRERNRAALQARREQLESDFEREVEELEKCAGEAKGGARSWWSDTKRSIEQQIGDMRADFEKWQAEHKEKSVERAAEGAEEDAVVAVTLSAYCLDAAEWAVLRAELARAEADKLAGKR